MLTAIYVLIFEDHVTVNLKPLQLSGYNFSTFYCRI